MTSISELITSLGVDIAYETPDRIRARCPLHVMRKGHESRHPDTFSVCAHRGTYWCHTCHAKGGITDLLNALGVPLSVLWSVDIAPTAPRDSSVSTTPAITPADVSIYLEYPLPPREELARRHITPKAADRYGIRYDGRSIVIPVTTLTAMGEEIHGFQYKSPSGVYSTKGLATGSYLFGLPLVEWLSLKLPVIVVESPLDVVRWWSLFGSDAPALPVATFGAHLTTRQAELLRPYNVVMAFDNDEAGEAATDAYLSKHPGHRFDYFDSSAKDIGEMTNTELRLLVECQSALWNPNNQPTDRTMS
jgi:hypothetical protein